MGNPACLEEAALDNDPHGGERNVSRLKDLAERLLDHDYHLEVDSDKPRLFLGELPTDIPADIPVPEGMLLLGGLRRVGPYRSEPDAQVILEAEAEPEGVYDAFREHLAGSEWSEKRPILPERGGFVHTDPGMRPLTFCLSDRRPALSVSAYRRSEAGTTEVRLRLEGSRRRDSPCSEDFDRYEYDEHSVIPALFPPEGVAQLSGGGGSSSNSEDNQAHLRTGMSPAAIVGHYSAQLEEAGWSRVGGGGEGPTAWSGWTFEDEAGERWVGTFVAMSLPGPSEGCFMQVSASAFPENLR
jgi:hypothetical protein